MMMTANQFRTKGHIISHDSATTEYQDRNEKFRFRPHWFFRCGNISKILELVERRVCNEFLEQQFNKNRHKHILILCKFIVVSVFARNIT